jgi:hypothetical protein
VFVTNIEAQYPCADNSLWTEGGVVTTTDLRFTTTNGCVDSSHNIGNVAGTHKNEQTKRRAASDACGNDAATAAIDEGDE